MGTLATYSAEFRDMMLSMGFNQLKERRFLVCLERERRLTFKKHLIVLVRGSYLGDGVWRRCDFEVSALAGLPETLESWRNSGLINTWAIVLPDHTVVRERNAWRGLGWGL